MTTETKRDLTADLSICDAACRGPWVVDENVASQIRQPNVSNRRRITLPPDANGFADATFIAAARTGWPEAIRRALAAEAENARMRDTLTTILSHAWNDVNMREGGVSVGMPKFSGTMIARDYIRMIEWALESTE
jgi:hypothetical protein